MCPTFADGLQAMLYALAGEEMVRSAYAEAVQNGYLWHEFGDSNLLLPRR